MNDFDDGTCDWYCEGQAYNCPRHWPGEVESEGNSGPLCHEQASLIWVVIKNQQLPMFGILVSEHDDSARASWSLFYSDSDAISLYNQT